MPDGFMSGTENFWQQSSGPYCNRYFEAADLWPHGAESETDGGNKDVLAAGLHPVLAIGATANRPCNLTGIVVDYENANRVLVNVADCFITRQYVANVLTYSGASANSWSSSIDAGQCVYVDDSGALASGVTLSLAPTNASGSTNPKAGYVMYCQDDYDDSDFGGADQAGGGLPHTPSGTATEYTLMCVMLAADP
jgi:hypothetical protein